MTVMTSPVDDIKAKIDIVDLISEYTPLKSAGTNWKARCPFHNEKTPSFMVSRERANWHCFGCGRGGDIFSFVQEMEGLDFPESLRLLAKRAGVQLKEYDPKISTQRTKLLDVVRWVSRYYHEVLLKSTEAEAARQYLRRRGLTDETIEEFQIGFAPNAWDTTYQAMKKKGLADDDIFQAGMTIRKDRGAGYYDRFRGRVMFPISDAHGAVVGFTGRIIEELVDPKSPPPAKYVNSPQTLIYNKSLVLFGLDMAKQAIKKADRAVLVEGHMDCVASHQAGVHNVVAVSGTALTMDQVQLIKRFTTNLVFSFDQDAAGAQAAVRGVIQALEANMNVFALRLPFGKDPDELIRKDPAAWPTAIAAAQPAMDYFIDEAIRGRNLQQVQDKKYVAQAVLPIIAHISNKIEQSHYLQRLADLVKVDVASLLATLPRIKPSAKAPATTTLPANPQESPLARDRARAMSEQLLAVVLRYPKILDLMGGSFDAATLSGDDLQGLYKSVVMWYSQSHVTSRPTGPVSADHFGPEYQEIINLLSLLGDKEYPEALPADLEQETLSMIAGLKRNALSNELRQIEAELGRLERGGATAADQVTNLLKRVRTLTDQLRDLP